jgi:class 3 adenylate cyclase
MDASFCNACGVPLDSAPVHATTPGLLATVISADTGNVHVSHTRLRQEAERRQLTVMFCDLVASTLLAERLDPEDLREVIHDYQATCAAVIDRFEGHIAQYLGDGLLVYFGYPQAHEDDAQRAVRAGLGILAAIASLNGHLEQHHGVQLAVRLGIHTGLVVVGGVDHHGRQEQLALGVTPNIAARLQGLASPNTLVVSAATHRLIQGYFRVEELGMHTLAGVSAEVQVWRVLRASAVRSRLEATSPHALTTFVGRGPEMTLLDDRWSSVQADRGQVVVVSGEAGIGKSRLVQVFKDDMARGDYTTIECQTSPYSQHSALYPVVDLLERRLDWDTHDAPETKLTKLETMLAEFALPMNETVPLFATLLAFAPPEDRYPPLVLTPERQRQKLFEALVFNIIEQAERQPVLFILEDLHWSDPSTMELLDLLMAQVPATSIMMLLTCRPEFDLPWGFRSHLTPITLQRLPRIPIERIIHRVTGGKALPADLIEQLVDKTDGIPLFIEEMTKAVLESGQLHEINGQYKFAGPTAVATIPMTLQDSLMARLDRLTTAKGVAQMGAVLGRQFSYGLLQAILPGDEDDLQQELARLVASDLIYQRGVPPQSTYVFKHALIRDAAYESLLRSTRQGYHRRIAEVLEERFPEIAETQPEILAYHYTEAGLNERAVIHWYQAGQQAVERSANREALTHLGNVL